jgi:hypothetical protein
MVWNLAMPVVSQHAPAACSGHFVLLLRNLAHPMHFQQCLHGSWSHVANFRLDACRPVFLLCRHPSQEVL